MSGNSSTAKCDLCMNGDGWQGNTMVRCTSCQVTVHKECYGLETYQGSTFICWACRAVGKKFQVDDRDSRGRRRMILQESRPTKCDLCSHDEGIHAMHPLYDNGGEGGRQLYDPKSDRLVWAHTLCAFVLTNSGLMYGCLQDGSCGEDDDPDISDDERSINPEAEKPSEGNFGDEPPVHHFVYYVEGRANQYYLNAVKERQNALTCDICERDDTKDGIFRIPIQCCAYDEDENKTFRKAHSDESENCCSQSFHVGCARWGDPRGVQRVFYDPTNDPNMRCRAEYCCLHAKQVDEYLQKGTQKGKDHAIRENAKMNRRPSKEKSTYRQMKELLNSASNDIPQEIALPGVPKSKKRTTPGDSLLPILENVGSKERATSKTVSAATSKAPPTKKRPNDDLIGQQIGETKKKKPKWHDGFDRSDAAALKDVVRPLLKDNRRELANSRSVVKESQVEQIAKDLLEKQAEQEQRKDRIPGFLKGARKFWRRRYSELTKQDFDDVWNQAKGKFQKSLEEAVAAEKKASAAAAAAAEAAKALKPLRSSDDQNDNSRDSSRETSEAILKPRNQKIAIDLTDEKEPSLVLVRQVCLESIEPDVEPFIDLEKDDESTETEAEQDDIGPIPGVHSSDEESEPEHMTRSDLTHTAAAATSRLVGDSLQDEKQHAQDQDQSKKSDSIRKKKNGGPKNPYSHLVIGRNFKIGTEFAFDDWNELTTPF